MKVINNGAKFYAAEIWRYIAAFQKQIYYFPDRLNFETTEEKAGALSAFEFMEPIIKDCFNSMDKIIERMECSTNVEQPKKNIMPKTRKPRKQKTTEEILDSKVTEMEFTKRILTKLSELNIETVKDLVQFDKKILFSQPGFGLKCQKDVTDVLKRYGLKIGMT